MPIAVTITAGNCDGVASRPRVRNMAIWLSQVVPSWNRFSATACRMRALPAISPATNTARKPLPSSMPAAAKMPSDSASTTIG